MDKGGSGREGERKSGRETEDGAFKRGSEGGGEMEGGRELRSERGSGWPAPRLVAASHAFIYFLIEYDVAILNVGARLSYSSLACTVSLASF